MNITQSLTLFDYVKSYEQGSDPLAAVVKQTHINQAQKIDELSSSLVNIEGIDALVEKIQQGESQVNQKTITDMLDFYRNQVMGEIDQLREKMGLSSEQNFTHVEGKWQYLATDDNGESSEADTSKAEEDFMRYLNRDQRLGGRMEKLLSLSALSETSESQNYALQLQQADFSDSKVEDYLVTTRDKINASNYFFFKGETFSSGVSALAKQQFERYMQENNKA